MGVFFKSNVNRMHRYGSLEMHKGKYVCIRNLFSNTNYTFWSIMDPCTIFNSMIISKLWMSQLFYHLFYHLYNLYCLQS